MKRITSGERAINIACLILIYVVKTESGYKAGLKAKINARSRDSLFDTNSYSIAEIPARASELVSFGYRYQEELLGDGDERECTIQLRHTRYQ